MKEKNLNSLVLDKKKNVLNLEPLLYFAKKCYNAVEAFASDDLKIENRTPRRLQIFYTPDEEFFSVVIGVAIKKRAWAL